MRPVHTDLHREPQHEERQAGGEKVVEEREREGRREKEREGGQLLQRGVVWRSHRPHIRTFAVIEVSLKEESCCILVLPILQFR